jgi:ATP-binding cassette subfamily B protein
MLILSPTLTLAVAVVIPPIAVLTGYLRRRIRAAERATRTAVGEATTQLQEDLAGVDVIRAFGRRDQFSLRFRTTLSRWLAAGNTSTRYNAFYAPALAVLSAIATAALLLLGGGGVARIAGVSIGTLTAFVLLFSRFFTPLVNLGDEWQNVQAALAGAERVFSLLAQPGRNPRRAAPEATDETPIALGDVGFSYAGGPPVLQEIDLTLEQGTAAELLATEGTFAALLALEEAGWDLDDP